MLTLALARRLQVSRRLAGDEADLLEMDLVRVLFGPEAPMTPGIDARGAIVAAAAALQQDGDDHHGSLARRAHENPGWLDLNAPAPGTSLSASALADAGRRSLI